MEMGVNLLSAPYHMKKKWKKAQFLWKTCTFLSRFWLRKKNNFFINENFGQFLSKQAVYEFFSMKTRFCGFSRNFSSKKLIFFKISFFRLFRIFRQKIEKMGFIFQKNRFLGENFREKPQNRVFIVKNSYTAYSNRNYPKFSFIKKNKFFSQPEPK